MDTGTIYYNSPKNVILFNRDREPVTDTSRIYTNISTKSLMAAFLGRFPARRFSKCRDNGAGAPGETAENIHYPQAPAGKTALNDSLTMTIGGVSYTVKSVFAEDGGDLREMLEAAVVSRAARSLSSEKTAQRADISLTGEPVQETGISLSALPARQEA